MTDEISKPAAGDAIVLTPQLRVVLAMNPSPMTHWGTNTYLLGTQELAVIDPGPDDEAHLSALLKAAGDTPISHIIVTHNHLDHSPLAARLSQQTGAPIYAFGNHLAGRSNVMRELADAGLAGGGEGIDGAFNHDVTVADGDLITGADWSLRVLHTPGHIANHICLIWGDAVFTGDHVMGWASSLVSPPDGDLTQFMESCGRLRDVPACVYYAGHGAAIHDPIARLDWLITHRQTREHQIMTALSNGSATALALTHEIYHDVAPMLLMAAQRNVFAHLIDLHARGLVDATPSLSATAIFARKN